MKKKEKTKKTKQIKAKQYEENNEFEDNYSQDDEKLFNEENEYIEKTDISLKDESEEYEEEMADFTDKKTSKFMKIFNIIFVISIIVMIIIATDVICITKYNVGPFFAIKTNNYKDGGTKVYYGLGYKVIKYNVIEGRKDTQIGFWNMPYSITPTPIDDIDLAIEFQNNPKKTANKYYKQYLQITSEIKEIDKDKNKLILQYIDPDGKYTLEINCQMLLSEETLINYKEKQKITVRGTIYKFSLRDNNSPNTVYLSNCFAEILE